MIVANRRVVSACKYDPTPDRLVEGIRVADAAVAVVFTHVVFDEDVFALFNIGGYVDPHPAIVLAGVVPHLHIEGRHLAVVGDNAMPGMPVADVALQQSIADGTGVAVEDEGDAAIVTERTRRPRGVKRAGVVDDFDVFKESAVEGDVFVVVKLLGIGGPPALVDAALHDADVVRKAFPRTVESFSPSSILVAT